MAEPGQAGDRACDRCRERRVKCDKTHPSCLRCAKLGKPCPGYDKKRKFVDEGVSLRKKYASNRTTSGDHESDCGADLAGTPDQASIGYPSHKHDTVDLSNTASPLTRPRFALESRPSSSNEIPKPAESPATFSNLYQSSAGHGATAAMSDPLLFPDAVSGLGVDADLDAFRSDATFDPEWFNLEPSVYYADGNNSCGFIPNVEIVDEVDKNGAKPSAELASETPMSGVLSFPDASWNARESQLHTSAIITDEREHEMAYLIRHFTESIGPWMDLFDRDRHFAHLVPLKALRDRLLRNAIAAVSAKQLGRVKGHKLYLGNQSQRPATMEIIHDITDGEWFYKAANYYDKAIAFSREYLQRISGTLSNPPSPNTRAPTSMVNSDDLLVAVSIFSLYESLDNLEMGWLQHLTGLKSLLTAISANQQEQMQLVPSITVGRQASFWNFARADYQAAYINGQKTLLDTEDLDLWRSHGLEVQDGGALYMDVDQIRNDPLHCRAIAQLVSHTLLWLLLGTTNFCAIDRYASASVRQSNWDRLTGQLDFWYSNLPQTFQPCAQMRYPLKRSPGSEGNQLTEVFFSIDQCAAAIQLYHFARILLLLNKPESSTSRLKAYREVFTEAIKHAREIVGIALGRPHPAVRVEMLLPLHTAGTCLESDEERKVVIELLRAIEKDTGCSADARVLSLIEEWGWSQEPGDDRVM